MGQDTIKKIINLCRKIDENACEFYNRLSQLEGSGSLSDFWLEMSKEESEHITFWKQAEQIEEVSGIPALFENPEQVLADLAKALSRSLDLLANCEEDCSVANQFMSAYRMEFYLLHPAFEVLFHLLGPTTGGKNPEDDYDSHIAKFIEMLAKHGDVTPELELLGETLERLWKENKRLVSIGSTFLIAEGIRRTIEETPLEGIPVTVSIGFAEATLGQQVQQDYDQLIQKADQALYQAKETGRNKVVEYRPESGKPQHPSLS